MTLVSIRGYFPTANSHRAYINEAHILYVLACIQAAFQNSKLHETIKKIFHVKELEKHEMKND